MTRAEIERITTERARIALLLSCKDCGRRGCYTLYVCTHCGRNVCWVCWVSKHRISTLLLRYGDILKDPKLTDVRGCSPPEDTR